MEYRDLTTEERAALQRFADAHHKQKFKGTHRLTWREWLSDVYWYNARIWSGGEPGDGSVLHGLRNDLGPTWLYDVCNVKPTPRARR